MIRNLCHKTKWVRQPPLWQAASFSHYGHLDLTDCLFLTNSAFYGKSSHFLIAAYLIEEVYQKVLFFYFTSNSAKNCSFCLLKTSIALYLLYSSSFVQNFIQMDVSLMCLHKFKIGHWKSISNKIFYRYPGNYLITVESFKDIWKIIRKTIKTY